MGQQVTTASHCRCACTQHSVQHGPVRHAAHSAGKRSVHLGLLVAAGQGPEHVRLQAQGVVDVGVVGGGAGDVDTNLVVGAGDDLHRWGMAARLQSSFETRHLQLAGQAAAAGTTGCDVLPAASAPAPRVEQPLPECMLQAMQ